MSVAKHYDGCACTHCTRKATIAEVRRRVGAREAKILAHFGRLRWNREMVAYVMERIWEEIDAMAKEARDEEEE